MAYPRVATRLASRRTMSSSHGAKQSSDLPWIIGSIVVFGGSTGYLLTPTAKHEAKHVVHEHTKQEDGTYNKLDSTAQGTSPSKAEPIKDDDGEEASGAEVGKSLDAGFKADSPGDAQAAEAKGDAPSQKPYEPVKETPSDGGENKEIEGDKPQGGTDKKPEDKDDTKEHQSKDLKEEQPKAAKRSESMKTGPSPSGSK